jgi:hypothetical protein
MSCATPTSCMIFVTVRQGGDALWNGTTWTLIPTPNLT